MRATSSPLSWDLGPPARTRDSRGHSELKKFDRLSSITVLDLAFATLKFRL